METYFLLLIMTALFIFVLFIERDLFSPSAIICESFLLSLLTLSLNINEWSVRLSMKTIFIILIGNIVFIVTSLLCRKIFNKKSEDKKNRENKLIHVKKCNFNIMLIISILISALYVISFYKAVGGFSNYGELSRAINYYRVSVSYDLGDASALPTIVVQLFKVLKVFALISAYIFINNHFYYKVNVIKLKKQVKFLIPLLLFLPLSLLTGNRSELSTILIALIILWSMTSIRYGYKFNFKKIRNYLLLIVVLFSLFSITKTIAGRTSKSEGFDYFSIYFGAPIELFDLYIKKPPPPSSMLGKETFWSLNNTLLNLQGKDSYQVHLEVRYANGIKLGNVYTAYRNMYQDFGLVGMIVLQIMISIIFTKMYYTIRNRNSNGKISIYELMYALMIHVLFFYSFSEQFYNTVISLNYITLFVIFLVVILFLTKIKFSRKEMCSNEP